MRLAYQGVGHEGRRLCPLLAFSSNAIGSVNSIAYCSIVRICPILREFLLKPDSGRASET
jgi:hypothetical protein